MRKSCTYGSARGASSNGGPYRDRREFITAPRQITMSGCSRVRPTSLLNLPRPIYWSGLWFSRMNSPISHATALRTFFRSVSFV